MEVRNIEEDTMIDRYTTSPQIITAVDNIDPVDAPLKLTPYEYLILEALQFPRGYKTLYKILDIPEPSIRRVMHFLKERGLVEKTPRKKWRRI